MKSSGDSSLVEQPIQWGEGGSIPTSPLQLHKRDWRVADCDVVTARNFIETFHYARGASNTATHLHGLYPANWIWYADAVGIAWWIPPTRSCAEWWAGESWEGVLSLSRLAIAPGIPTNACSFLLSKSVKMIDRARWHTLVTYADSWQGHTGQIYLASGWVPFGETKPEPLYIKDNRMIARKAGPRTRTHAEMLSLGCKFVGRFSKKRFALTTRHGIANGNRGRY